MGIFDSFVRDDDDAGSPAAPAPAQDIAPVMPPPQWGITDGKYVERIPIRLFDALAPGTYKPSQTCEGELAVAAYAVSTEKLIRVPNATAPRILASINKFWEARKRYVKLGMLHRRGLLLFGKQGIGKTALISEVCEGLIDDGGIVLVATGGNLHHFVAAARMIRKIEPQRPLLLLIEDIERFLKKQEEQLLSVLSGQDQLNNTIVLATTNHIEQLPPRLINRPARFDEIIELKPFDLEQRRYFLSALSQSEDSVLIDQLAAGSEGYAVAHMKELVVGVFALDEDAQEVLARLNAMIARENGLANPTPTPDSAPPGSNESSDAAPTPKLATTAWVSGQVNVYSQPDEIDEDEDFE